MPLQREILHKIFFTPALLVLLMKHITGKFSMTQKKVQSSTHFRGFQSRKQWPIKYSSCFVEKYWEVISRESVTGIVCTQRASNWAENTVFGSRRIIAAGRKFAPLFSPSIQPRSIISDCLCLCSAPLWRCLTCRTEGKNGQNKNSPGFT